MDGGSTADRSERQAAAEVALGRRPADLLVTGGNVINVLTGETYRADVAVSGRRIALVGDVDHCHGAGTVIVEARGSHLAPGLIDQHAHIHESQTNLVEFAAAVLPHGTTGVVTDLYGEIVVGGMPAARLLLEIARQLPLKIWFVAGYPAYAQNRPFGHSGWPTHDDMLEMLGWDDCFGMDDASATGTIAGDPHLLELIEATQSLGKKVSGHGAQVEGKEANAWIAFAEELDDHECTTAAEAVEKARLGYHVVIREGAGCYDLDEVLKAITTHGVDPRRFSLCTDVPPLARIVSDGHIDSLVRRIIQHGVPVVDAVRMATLNTAECLRISHQYGSVAPGKRADMILVDDLASFHVQTVLVDGIVRVRGAQLVQPLPQVNFPDWASSTVRLARKCVAADFRLPTGRTSDSVIVRVIGAFGDTIITEERHERLLAVDGEVRANAQRGIAKIAALERVRGSGQIGVGLVHGFGLRAGALATTFNSQAENVMVVGMSDEDMAVAVNTLGESGGGFVVVEGEEVIALLPLPLFGLESAKPYATAYAELRAVNQAASDLGCSLPDPFTTLGFVGLPVEVGTLKMAPEGLVDVWSRQVMHLVVE